MVEVPKSWHGAPQGTEENYILPEMHRKDDRTLVPASTFQHV